MTGTQREPGEGQRQRKRPRDTSLENKEGKRKTRERKGKRNRREGKNGQRDSKERPAPALAAGSADHPYLPAHGTGAGAPGSVGTEVAIHPHPLTWPQPPPLCLHSPDPGADSTQAATPAPGSRALSWPGQKWCFLTHFWALQNPQPIPPPLFLLLPEEEENLVSNWC